MCGISGWYAWGAERPTAHILKGLLLANMERGTSATGMAWLEGDQIICRKGKGPATAFIEGTSDEIFATAAQSPRGLLHARATTKGSENENANNHPVVGLGWLAVHNGTIGNDDDLWGYYAEKEGVKRFAEVDTSAIPLMLSRGSTIEESIQKLTVLSGSATIAAWSESQKDHLLLGRFGHNDLHMFYDPAKQILYWSSAPSAGYVMRGLVMGKHKFLTMSRLADQHVMLLSPEGMDATRVFKLTQIPFFAARKVTGRVSHGPHTSGPMATQTGGLGPGGTVASRPSGQRSRGSVVILPPASTPGWTEMLHKERQSDLIHGKDYLKVVFKAPTDAIMLAALWRPMDREQGKPHPTTDVFARSWWNLRGIMHLLKQPDSVVMEITKESAYGRWTIGVKKDTREEYMSFKGHKRVKAWWDRLYRVQFKFPLEIGADGKTELDHHMAWEHYDIHLQKSDKSTIMFLGFMCPWCGVWSSSTRVQEMKHRCEFCCVVNRITPIGDGDA